MKDPKKVPNTTQDPRPEWLLGGNPNAIEQQESDGQAALAQSAQLPTDMAPLDKTELEKLGVKFLTISEGDPLFYDVELPPGMRIVPTDHSMWSDLVDAKEGKVAGIFYKAAFYDRSAYLNFIRSK